MSNEFPKVGVSAVYENAEQFMQQVNAATKSVEQQAGELSNLVKAMSATGLSIQEISAALKSEGFAANEVNKAIAPLIEAQRAATRAQLDTAEAAKTVTKAYSDEEHQAFQLALAQKGLGDVTGGGAGAGPTLAQKQLNEALAETATGTTRAVNGLKNVYLEQRALRGASMEALFGLQMFTIALGDKLPVAAQEAVKALQLVSAGAMTGMMFGTEGMVLGAVTGGLIALGIAGQTVTPQVSALNKEIQTLAGHGDAAKGLADLAGVSQDVAKAAMEAAKANADEAASLQDLINKAETAQKPTQMYNDALKQGYTDTQARSMVEYAYGVSITATSLAAQKALANEIALANQRKAVADLFTTVSKGVGPRDATADAIVQLSGVTQDAATKAIAYAKANDDAAESLLKLFTNLQQTQQAYQDGIVGAEALANAYKMLKDRIDELAGAQDKSVFNARATKLSTDLMKVQRESMEDMQAAVEAYEERLSQITADGVQRRIDIQQAYSDRLKEIEDNRIESEAVALDNYNQSVIDAEQNAADRRAQLANELTISIADAEEQAAQRRIELAQDYQDTIAKQAESHKDKLLKIELDYQNAIRAIQDTYNLAVYNAIINQDAKALVLAAMAREKALRAEEDKHQEQVTEAEKQREKDAKAADDAYEKARRHLEEALARQEEKLRDNYEKQMRALAESLRKEEERLREGYEKRLAELERAAAKQRDAAEDTRDKDLRAQEIAQQKALTSEQNHYIAQQKALERAQEEKRRTLVEALVNEKGMMEDNARAILESMKRILSPEEMQQVLQDFTNAVQARINITVEPFTVHYPGEGMHPYAEGGYSAGGGPAMLHPNEVILPMNKPQRVEDLMSQYVMPRMSMAMPSGMGGMGSAGSSGGGMLNVRISLDNSMLNAQIEGRAGAFLTEVVRNVSTNLNRGAYG